MPVLHAADAVVHEMHGSVFTSYAAPARGSRELCAWRLEVPPGSRGVPHTMSKEEILLVLSGALRVTLDGSQPATDAVPGDAVLVGAGTLLQVDNPGPEPATAWVTTTVGLEAIVADGSAIRPPWTQ
jgi:quercetin dioxygenase-like cupin family protein